MMRRMILCLACAVLARAAAASPFVCVVITGFNAVDTCVEIKIYGAFVLNHRVVLHAIDATPARRRGGVNSSPLDRARTAASSPRNDLVKNCRVHPTHLLIFTQAGDPRRLRREAG